MTAKYYWEDFQPGMVIESAEREITEAQMLAFAREYDPQPFHVDADLARESPFGGLIASGWQTASICMRLYCDAILLDSAAIGSPGIDELRWTQPVRPGDRLRLRRTVIEARPSRSRPERGTVRSRSELFNQNGELVMHMTNTNFFRRRSPGAAAPE